MGDTAHRTVFTALVASLPLCASSMTFAAENDPLPADPVSVEPASVELAQGAPPTPEQGAPPELAQSGEIRTVPILICKSKPGERIHCNADTAKGVVLARSTGEAPCLLGKSWGYDDTGVWVSDGCSGAFVVGRGGAPAEGGAAQVPTKMKAPQHVPNAGFLLYDGDEAQIYMRLFTYVRYLNQLDLDTSYTDFNGVPHAVQRRQDVQLNKFFLPFSGWFMSPKLRYYLYVWSTNVSQGDPAQVVGAGNISWSFNRFVTLGGGITSLPSVRSTEGQFPYWLGVDDRLIADEFFRGSYTTGLWIKGELQTKLKYMAMIANNLSTLGVSAAQMDNTFDTQSYMLQWLPTTGEFGLYGTFGDYDWHQKLATRLGLHYTRSTENKQSQPGTDGIENSQIRLTDGSVIFTPDLFGTGITVTDVLYRMVSVDGGVKYKGLSLEGEFYWRRLSNFAGPGTEVLTKDIDDDGFQLQASGMAVKDVLQVYGAGSEIRGDFGIGKDLRAGVNWYPLKKRGLRVNAEWMNLTHCPVGYTAVPYPVGGNGDVFHVNVEMNW
jgi:hypothetical protein